MSNLAEVIKINDYKNNTNIAGYIDFYISKKFSNNTRKNYLSDIKQFFKYIFGTDNFNFITVDMLRNMGSINPQQFFMDMINGEKYCSSTICRKLSVVKDLLNDMTLDRIDGTNETWLDYNPLATFDYKEDKTETKSYGAFTHEEMLKIIDCAYKRNKELGLYYSLLYRNASRKTSTKEITVNDFYINKYGQYCMRGIDKGNKPYNVEIGERLYNEVMECATEDGVIFHFSTNYPLNKLCQKTTYKKNGNVWTNYKNSILYEIGISEEEASREERYLTIHSIKHSSMITLNQQEGTTLQDLVKHGKHGSAEYVSRYLQDNKVDSTGMRIDLENNIQEDTNNELQSKLNNLSKEELINLIMSADTQTKSSLMKLL